MQQRNYNYLLYFISLVILATLVIQVYWNYKNFQAGKQQLISEVQASLDNAVDSYYIDLADKNTVAFDLQKGDTFTNNRGFDSLLRKIDVYSTNGIRLDSIDPSTLSEVKVISGKNRNPADSLLRMQTRFTTTASAFSQADIIRGREEGDSIKNLFELTSRLIIAITTDSLNIPELNNYLNEQLRAKDLEIDFGYVYKNNSGNIQKFNEDLKDEAALSTVGKSAYLPKNSRFELFFTNHTPTILKRNLPGMMLSALLIASVVACLFFLLRIIQKQKQLAEIKNDLISNITHEFKTPISTVKVALEGMEHFNQQNDPVKTKNYLQVSNLQLNKLEMMVEKLLETATLDGDKLQLQKEQVSVVDLLKELVEKHQNLSPGKTFRFKSQFETLTIMADPFHLENALNNVLDNAVKYGGEIIAVEIFTEEQKLKIMIRDDGKKLTTSQAEQIFEKFYRVPSGNVHNIKGFGIGLYYTRQIIQKHKGEIKVNIDGSTEFQISLPHE